MMEFFWIKNVELSEIQFFFVFFVCVCLPFLNKNILEIIFSVFVRCQFITFSIEFAVR